MNIMDEVNKQIVDHEEKTEADIIAHDNAVIESMKNTAIIDGMRCKKRGLPKDLIEADLEIFLKKTNYDERLLYIARKYFWQGYNGETDG